MKRFVAGLVVGFVLALGVSAVALDQVRLLVNGKEVVSDVPPQIIDGRTLVPARALAEALGATVTWDAEKRAVVVTAAPKTTAPTDASAPFSGTVLVSGKVIGASLSYNEGGGVCVPLRTVSEFSEVTSPKDVPRDVVALDVDGVRITLADLWVHEGRSFVCAGTMTNLLKWQVRWDKATNTLGLTK